MQHSTLRQDSKKSMYLRYIRPHSIFSIFERRGEEREHGEADLFSSCRASRVDGDGKHVRGGPWGEFRVEGNLFLLPCRLRAGDGYFLRVQHRTGSIADGYG